MDEIERLDGLSMDIAAAEQEKLRTVFPQCFVEDKLDESCAVSGMANDRKLGFRSLPLI